MPSGVLHLLARRLYSVRLLQVPALSSFSLSNYSDRKRSPTPDPDEAIFQDIKNRINTYKKQLKRHSVASYKSRDLSTSITNLSQSMAAVQKKRTAAESAVAMNALAAIPAYVTVEVLSNGTTHMAPCVALRTPLKTYIFNCPEGTSRFLPALRMKSINVHDIFITRGTWSNIGGISSILLSKEQAAPPMRIHGAMNVKHFLECIRPFQDSDFGSVKYPSQVEECPYHLGSYEDAGVKVTYIPLSNPIDLENGGVAKGLTVDVAYLVELKEPAKKIDPMKLISMKVPKGPMIGRLKAGESITLSDGRTIHPEDVFSDEGGKSEKRHALIAECADLDRLDALTEHSVVRQFYGPSASKSLDYMIHLSAPKLMETEKYQKWANELGEGCQHIVANGSGPSLPHIESVYRNQRVLRKLLPAVFPALHPADWTGTVTQNSELCRQEGQWVYASPLQRFFMRQGGNEEPIIIDLRAGLSDDEQRQNQQRTEEEQKSVELRMEEMTKASSSIDPCEFPSVSFLGTSSAVPSKYRNVSAYLVETGPSSAFLVDVGEGTYGQIRVLFGVEKCKEMMVNIHAIFITHAHQDHMNGLYTIIERRKEAFEEMGLPYIPLVLACNKNVLKPLKTYSMCFADLEALVDILEFSKVEEVKSRSPSPNKGPLEKRRRHNSPLMPPVRDLTPMLPSKIYSKEKWCLDKVVAVQVHHTRMANGFVFSIGSRKLVFSGDTKPCQLLVEQGKGADLLVHEATFEDGCEQDAERKKHSTMGQAVEIGKKMEAKHVMLTHFSARYPKVPALPSYLDEAGNVGVAMDNMRARFDHLDVIPKLIPLYRDVYQEELFEIELRKEQRNLKERDEAATKAISQAKALLKQKSGKTGKTNGGYDYMEAKKRRSEQKPWTRPIARKVCADISMDSD